MKNLLLIILSTLLIMGAAKADTIAITNGIIHTITDAGVITGGTVIIRDDKIAAVGKNIAIPDNARVIDAKGRVVTPGFMDAYGYMGLVEVSSVKGSVDAAVDGDHFTAAFNVAPAINPRSTLIPINRIEGITRAVSAPWAGEGKSLIAGQGVVIHLGSVEDYIVKNPAAMFAVLGESGAAIAGGSRAAALLKLREAFLDARDFADNKADFMQRERREYSLNWLDLQALQPVLAGELPLVVSVDRASDIVQALKLADEFNLQLIIAGGAEAWMVRDKLAAARVPVILNPLQNLPSSFETLGSTLQNAAALHAAGVKIAFSTGGSHNARNIKQGAGNAVAYGLPWRAALKALTINPAQMFGIANQYGRLAPGMDADVVIWSGDPLEVTSFADAVFIKGRQIPMESRQTRLLERYLDLDDAPRQSYD
ncbi:MAG TPA: amidohydrolase family protein [Gammaproteobacteria bacterium]|nr:amidohydrolase family protein [Gammaproteobacteria bacterium]